MNPFDVFQKLLANAMACYHKHAPSKSRSGQVEGIPGEMLKYLSPIEKQALQNLSSDDLQLEKLPRDQVKFCVETEQFYDNRYYDQMLRDEKLEFDQKILQKK